MALIQLETLINAPIERCFDLSRSIDLHKISTSHTKEEAIDGVISGLIGLNETVKWRAKHFGVFQKLTVQITQFDYPHYFRDQVIKGIFKSFKHDHFFEKIADNQTLMKETLDFEAPLGFLGRIAEWLFLTRYLTRFLETRNEIIKEFAETERWKEVPGMELELNE